jgi:GT2 family glycosyltransferase
MVDAEDARPALSVVIPTLGNYGALRRVLHGFARQDVKLGTFEVIVVSDHAEPDPEAVDAAAEGQPYPVRHLRAQVPGASGNRNTGWAAARAPIVLFTDNDTVPVPRLVAEHLKWHRRFPEENVAILGHVRWAKGLKVTPFMKWLDHGVQFDFLNIRGTEATWAHLYSSNASIKRGLLEHVGGYDQERLPYGYEDLDLGYRAREYGLRVMYNRRAIVDHWRTMSIENWQARAPRLAASEWQFCQLHPAFAPYFYKQFADVAGIPPQGRRAARLTRLIPWRTPWLGRFIWSRASVHWRQQIAPYFLSEWERVASGAGSSVQSDVSAFAERASRSGAS